MPSTHTGRAHRTPLPTTGSLRTPVEAHQERGGARPARPVHAPQRVHGGDHARAQSRCERARANPPRTRTRTRTRTYSTCLMTPCLCVSPAQRGRATASPRRSCTRRPRSAGSCCSQTRARARRRCAAPRIPTARPQRQFTQFTFFCLYIREGAVVGRGCRPREYRVASPRTTARVPFPRQGAHYR